MVNPHRDSSGNEAPYEYVGYMYPVREFFYFFLEQKNADYEILCMIVRESRTPQVAVLKGLFAGVGVLDDASMIAARPVVLLRRKRQLDWRTALGGEIGYIPRGRVPEIARRQLSEEKITVRE